MTRARETLRVVCLMFGMSQYLFYCQGEKKNKILVRDAHGAPARHIQCTRVQSSNQILQITLLARSLHPQNRGNHWTILSHLTQLYIGPHILNG